MQTRKCKVCGRSFVPQSSSDEFCPGLCSVAGNMIAGRGDSRKPSTEYKAKRPRKAKKEVAEKGVPKETAGVMEPEAEEVKRTRVSPDKFPRVTLMYSLPLSERAAIAKTFTKEEEEYSRKISKRLLAEEKRLDEITDWNYGEEEEERLERYGWYRRDSIGDSDDGSI